MKNLFVLLCLCCVMVMVGCATPPKPMYMYNNYSATLYEMKSNPCEESVKAHLAELDSILQTAQKEGINPPPGICAEYAYWQAKNGNNDEALLLLNKEAEIYPESVVMVENLKKEFNL